MFFNIILGSIVTAITAFGCYQEYSLLYVLRKLANDQRGEDICNTIIQHEKLYKNNDRRGEVLATLKNMLEKNYEDENAK